MHEPQMPEHYDDLDGPQLTNASEYDTHFTPTASPTLAPTKTFVMNDQDPIDTLIMENFPDVEMPKRSDEKSHFFSAAYNSSQPTPLLKPRIPIEDMDQAEKEEFLIALRKEIDFYFTYEEQVITIF